MDTIPTIIMEIITILIIITTLTTITTMEIITIMQILKIFIDLINYRLNFTSLRLNQLIMKNKLLI